MSIVMSMLFGLALFIYGMNLMSKSLKSLSVEKIKYYLEKATSNRFKSFLIGIGTTAIIQSSSATSVILIGFLNAGMLKLTNAIPAIFGANIGTTVTAQLIAFKLTKIAPWFVIAGLIINFIGKKNKTKNLGMMIFGFGLLFFGLDYMGAAIKPLKSNPIFSEFFLTFGTKPMLGILAGVAVTCIFQSSSTTIGMLIALAVSGLIDFRSSFFILLGDNIGTCITALLASIGGNRASKRLALGHLMFNVIGTLLALSMAGIYLKYIPMFSSDVARQIANAHTAFNVITAVIFIMFVPWYVKLLKKMIKGDDYSRREAEPLDKNLLDTPSLAIDAIAKKLVSMTLLCRDALEKVETLVVKFNHKIYKEVLIDEESVDEIQKDATRYIIGIMKNSLSDNEATKIPNMLHSVNDLERVGDHCENIGHVALKKYEFNQKLTEEANNDLMECFAITKEFLTLTAKAIDEDDQDAARQTLELETKMNDFVTVAKQNHITRMKNDSCSIESGLIYNDIVIHNEKICDHLKNITQGIIHVGKR